MAINESVIRQLKKYMEEACFTYTDEWLLACVEWIKENYPSGSTEVLKKELCDQWKDANLQEMESSCLPVNLTAQRLVKLNGKYGLQVNSIRDIGESSYSQWTKLKKLENENSSVAATDSTEFTQTWQPTSKRCLYLNMTDGSQQIFGLEMQPIPALSLDMKPGAKVIIVGPVDCRRGVIHLKPNNLRVIGGEVEDLLSSNNMESILTTTLNITRNVTQSQPTTRVTSVANRSRSTSQNQATALANTRNDIMGDFPVAEAEDQFPASNSPFGDDDIFMEIDEAALLSTVSESEENFSNKLSSATVRALTQPTNPIKPYPVKVSEHPYIFLQQVQEKLQDLTQLRKVVHVKACISTVVSNIRVENGHWTLCVCINDGTGFLNCYISAEILNGIIGFTPSEMKRIKSGKTSEGKQRIAEGMNGLAQQLVHLNAIFAIEVRDDPIIIEIISLMLHHTTGIKTRLRQL